MSGSEARSARASWCLVLSVLACLAGPGCWHDVELPVNNGSLGGQVLISGGVRGARIWVDQLDLHTGDIHFHVGEAVTFEDLATNATIVAIDAAGNQSSVIRLVRPDVVPPALGFLASTVTDEGDDWVTFATDHSPEHAHIGDADVFELNIHAV
jgi:hypothetical protein